jgi:hypothetical protein
MTIKQIADAVGKQQRAVQYWAKKAGAKIASIGAKIASAGHGVSADYDLEETLSIIETGLGKNAAAVYRESATRSDMIEQIVSRLESKLSVPATLAKPAPKQISGTTQKRRFYGVDFDTGLKIISDFDSWPLDAFKFRELVMFIESDIDDFTKARHHVGIVFYTPVILWTKDDFERCWRYLCQKRGW